MDIRFTDCKAVHAFPPEKFIDDAGVTRMIVKMFFRDDSGKLTWVSFVSDCGEISFSYKNIVDVCIAEKR